MADHDDELAEAVRELTRTIEVLTHELEETAPRRRPPLRPPTPRELLSFTDEVALPALIAALNSTVRALETFQRSLELVRTEREVRDRTADAASVTGDRAAELRRTTLSRLDGVLSELQRATSEGALSTDDRAQDLLADARKLRDEVDERLERATEETEARRSESAPSTSAVEIDIEDGAPRADRGDDDGRTDQSNVDVDAELETLRDRYGEEDESGSDGEDGREDGTGDASDASDEHGGGSDDGENDEN